MLPGRGEPAPAGDASDPEALHQAGLRHAMEGRLEAAVEALSRAVISAPGHAVAHNNLGLALQSLGRMDEAVAGFRRAVEIRPSYRLARTNLGVALAALGRHDEAIAQYEAALRLEPNEPSTLNNLGAALRQTGQDLAAIEAFRKALAARPDFAEAAINLAQVLSEHGGEAEAMGHYRAALALRPDDADTHLKLAHLLHKTGALDPAITHFRRSIEIDPSRAAAHAGLGRVLQEIGDIEAARASFRKAIAAEPGSLSPYLDLVHISRLGADDPVLLALLDTARRLDSLSDEDKVSLRFALGKALADTGWPRIAFDHLLAGNAVRRRQIAYDERKTLLGLRRTQAVFTANYLRRWARRGAPSPLPVFIVGMPRSGSTLVEQILGNHPHVACAGETDALHAALQQHRTASTDWLAPSSLLEPTSEQIGAVSATYLERLIAAAGFASLPADVTRITNKMLSNFRHLGLISLLFPAARIVHTYRHPIDTCLSCFAVNFQQQPFTFDLGELGRYYRAYAILMHHWKQVLPTGAVLDVRYDRVVNDLEGSARAIVAHCGLDWDDACLRFYETPRPVKTASVEQVRRPIYTTSVRRWRPDEETLRPLLEGLGLTAIA